MIATVKTRAWICLVLLHAGLALAIGAIATAAHGDAAQLTGWSLALVLGGVLAMYSAFVLAALSVWMPLRPWMRRYERARQWREWVLHELPTILALIPVLITAFKILKSAWAEIKEHHATGDLGVAHLATVAQKFANQAEELARDPSVERAKSKIRDAGSR